MTTIGIPPATVVPYAPPSSEHWLGADALGRSFLPMLLKGAAWTLADVAGAATLALAIAALVAIWGSVFRGAWGRFVFGVASTFSFATPLVAVLLLLYSFLGDHPVVFPLTAGLLLWGTASLTLQTAIAQEMRSTYIRAARGLGIGRLRVLTFHLLPNLVPAGFAAWLSNWPAMLSASILAAYLGAHSASPRLGSLLKAGYDLFPGCWWLWLPPTLMACLSFAFLFLSTERRFTQKTGP